LNKRHMFTGKKVLVTGGTGFIGHHLVDKLAEIGAEVRVLARNTSNVSKLINNNNVEIVNGDLGDIKSLETATEGVDIVYHLAAKLHVPLDSDDPELQSVNVDGTKNLLDACVSQGVTKFVFFSSMAVSFGSDSDILDESTLSSPMGRYGEGKIKAGELALQYHERHGIDTTILIPVVVYGKGEIGNVAKLINYINKRRFVLIGDGSTMRSIVYINNVVEAALCVAENPLSSGQTYIVTDKDNYSLKQMAEFISTKLNVPLYRFHIPVGLASYLALIGDFSENYFKLKLPFNSDILKRLMTNQLCSSRKIQEELGFVPTTFEEGMSENLDLFISDNNT